MKVFLRLFLFLVFFTSSLFSFCSVKEVNSIAELKKCN